MRKEGESIGDDKRWGGQTLRKRKGMVEELRRRREGEERKLRI